MDSSASGDEVYGRNSNSRRFGIQFPDSNFLRAPLAALLEHTGIFGGASAGESEDRLPAAAGMARASTRRSFLGPEDGDETDGEGIGDGDEEEEVSIRIIGASEHDGDIAGNRTGNSGTSDGGASDGVAGDSGGGGARESSYQRYDIQHFARWFEQILPFTLLLLLVFIRQHYQGQVSSKLLFDAIWMTLNSVI